MNTYVLWLPPRHGTKMIKIKIKKNQPLFLFFKYRRAKCDTVFRITSIRILKPVSYNNSSNYYITSKNHLYINQTWTQVWYDNDINGYRYFYLFLMPVIFKVTGNYKSAHPQFESACLLSINVKTSYIFCWIHKTLSKFCVTKFWALFPKIKTNINKYLNIDILHI